MNPENSFTRQKFDLPVVTDNFLNEICGLLRVPKEYDAPVTCCILAPGLLEVILELRQFVVKRVENKKPWLIVTSSPPRWQL